MKRSKSRKRKALSARVTKLKRDADRNAPHSQIRWSVVFDELLFGPNPYEVKRDTANA